MSFKINITPFFGKEVKKLAKKYPSLKKDLVVLFEQLSKKPTMGDHLGNGVYKIRMVITSKGRGKSGGARVISFLRVESKNVYLLSIYDKGDLQTISKEKISVLLKKMGFI